MDIHHIIKIGQSSVFEILFAFVFVQHYLTVLVNLFCKNQGCRTYWVGGSIVKASTNMQNGMVEASINMRNGFVEASTKFGVFNLLSHLSFGMCLVLATVLSTWHTEISSLLAACSNIMFSSVIMNCI
jgi:hypothetical protein